jgi:hypothetical protein
MIDQIPTIGAAIDGLRARSPEAFQDAPDDAPIFIMANSWRSGSTLLQRLLLSSGETLMWGEPYDRCAYIQSLAESLRAFSFNYPPDRFYADPSIGQDWSRTWVANLYPSAADLIRAHREFFRALFAVPAEAMGYRRWGIKEVRLSIEHARYLQTLFPRARIVFLVRNPYDAYRSYRSWRSWYNRWPNEPVFTPGEFGKMWRTLGEGYVAGAHSLGAPLIRYEDLGDPRQLEVLEEYLGMRIDATVMEERQRGPRLPAERVPTSEMLLLKRQVEPLAQRLGYQPPVARAGSKGASRR